MRRDEGRKRGGDREKLGGKVREEFRLGTAGPSNGGRGAVKVDTAGNSP